MAWGEAEEEEYKGVPDEEPVKKRKADKVPAAAQPVKKAKKVDPPAAAAAKPIKPARPAPAKVKPPPAPKTPVPKPAPKAPVNPSSPPIPPTPAPEVIKKKPPKVRTNKTTPAAGPPAVPPAPPNPGLTPPVSHPSQPSLPSPSSGYNLALNKALKAELDALRKEKQGLEEKVIELEGKLQGAGARETLAVQRARLETQDGGIGRWFDVSEGLPESCLLLSEDQVAMIMSVLQCENPSEPQQLINLYLERDADSHYMTLHTATTSIPNLSDEDILGLCFLSDDRDSLVAIRDRLQAYLRNTTDLSISPSSMRIRLNLCRVLYRIDCLDGLIIPLTIHDCCSISVPLLNQYIGQMLVMASTPATGFFAASQVWNIYAEMMVLAGMNGIVMEPIAWTPGGAFDTCWDGDQAGSFGAHGDAVRFQGWRAGVHQVVTPHLGLRETANDMSRCIPGTDLEDGWKTSRSTLLYLVFNGHTYEPEYTPDLLGMIVNSVYSRIAGPHLRTLLIYMLNNGLTKHCHWLFNQDNEEGGLMEEMDVEPTRNRQAGEGDMEVDEGVTGKGAEVDDSADSDSAPSDTTTSEYKQSTPSEESVVEVRKKVVQPESDEEDDEEDELPSRGGRKALVSDKDDGDEPEQHSQAEFDDAFCSWAVRTFGDVMGDLRSAIGGAGVVGEDEDMEE